MRISYYNSSCFIEIRCNMAYHINPISPAIFNFSLSDLLLLDHIFKCQKKERKEQIQVIVWHVTIYENRQIAKIQLANWQFPFENHIFVGFFTLYLIRAYTHLSAAVPIFLLSSYIEGCFWACIDHTISKCTQSSANGISADEWPDILTWMKCLL